VAGTGDSADLACVRLVDVAQTATLVAGTTGTLLLPLIALSTWAEPATVVAGPSSEGAALASPPSVRVDSASLCVGGHDT
jgi:hypothetical protein